MIVSETTIRVRYADTDQMKMAYYGRYFEYFEQSRSDLLRKMGLPYPEIERLGFYLPVIEAHANYMKPARYDDSLIVTAIVKDSPMARIRIDYEVRGESDRELLATGHTVHSFVNASSGKPTRAPEQFLEKFTSANSGS
jgi:acyl-CoA thioester hydrolase